ncbi:hypothetical protein N7G274_009749 [Stereocaulon virgatum]|uniref:C2H2-type domain-containing protein n=1 Tax=Stereocaulon virgatum TaxID=373712 RepID=A0ABR3ZVX1_9LECA
MSFFDQQHDPTRREDLDPRINAWRETKPNIASLPGYVQTAQKAQKSASGSSTVGGKVVMPFHANARDNLSSNVRGFHNTNKSGPSFVDTDYRSVTNQSAWSGTPPASVRGQSADVPAFAGSASRMSGPAFKPDVRGGSASNSTGQASSSRAPPAGSSSVPKASMPSTGAAGQPSSSKSRESIPPHRRPSPSASSASTSKPTKGHSKSSLQMNAGIVAKSAKDDSNFPCTYKDCDRGFAKEKDLKDHKDEEHEWCRLCKMDFEEFDDLLEHKIYSERHICCAICGEDFRSEGGRDKHQRQMHATEQNIKCPGCGYIFEKGAGLVAHIYANQCTNRGGGLSNSVNELKIRESRAAAALHINQLLNRPSETGALIAAMQPSETGDFQSINGSVGGVALTPSYLDADIPNSENIEAASTMTGTSNVGDDGQSPVRGRGSVGLKMVDTVDWPTVEDSKAMGKKKERSVIQGLGALTMRDSNGSGPKTGGSEAHIPGIKPIPAIGEWTAPTMPDFRRNIIPSESGSEHIIRTDWDAMKFERHGLDGHYHCPFTGCKANYLELNDLLYHLTSGYHQGTDHRCLKCLKIFKSAQALIAHMESNSERCRMKDTYGFGNVLHVVSGGFLGVKGRHKDGTIKIEAPDVPDEERYKLNVENDFEDEEEPRILEGMKTRMLMPHERKQPTADEMLS